jgi:hypothetical protein
MGAAVARSSEDAGMMAVLMSSSVISIVPDGSGTRGHL